jgi:Tfp pilus assembly pilus retraction ATPase PilT
MLSSLPFNDLYLGQDQSWFAGLQGESQLVPAPAELLPELAALRSLCLRNQDNTSRDEFTIRHQNMAYRASVIRSISDVVFVLRRLPVSVPSIMELNIHPGLLEQILRPNITGLIVIAGAFGQGKTTTASALIKERLTRYGGVAITIEDPPELPLEGPHGNGVCYQTWVDQGEFGDMCRKTARYAPNIIFLGEVRDSETASEALRASINGRLVICTTHADSVPMSIERLYTLANGTLGTSEDVASLLANGLLCIMHQTLEGEPKRPRIESLWLGDEENQGVRHMIRQRRFDHVSSEIHLQRNRLLSSSRVSPKTQADLDRLKKTRK